MKSKMAKVIAGLMVSGILLGGKSAVFAQQAGQITVAEAKAAALKDAGLEEKDVVFYGVGQDFDDGFLIQEVNFFCGNMEYEYDLDAMTGMIIERSCEAMDAEDKAENQAKADFLKMMEAAK